MPPSSPRECLSEIAAGETPAADGSLHLYDRYAPLYDYLFTARYDYDRQRDMIVEGAPPGSYPTILEGGTGTGQLLARLESEYDRVAGVDLSERMLSLARERVETATLYQADLGTMTLEETFSALVMVGRVICHADSRAGVRDLLENCLAPLRGDARLLVDFYDREGLPEDEAGSLSASLPPYELTATATHEFHDTHTFDWSYRLSVTDESTGRSGTLEETAGPWLRFSREEVDALFSDLGFEIIETRENSPVGEPPFSTLAVAEPA